MLSVLSDREDCTQKGHSPRSVVQPFTYVGTHQPVWTGATGRRRAAMVDRARLKAFEHSNNHDALAAHR